jgi:acid phosphatase (class A)
LAGSTILKSTYSLLSLVLCAGILCSVAQAEDTPTKWLTSEQKQALVDSVPPPPVPGSDADKADLATLLQIQDSRTDTMIAEAKLDQKFSDLLFQPTYGEALTPANSPKFYDLMKNVLKITVKVDEAAKAKYKRPRPYQGHSDTVHSLFPVWGFSYPSGHSMASYTLAVVLGAVFPDKAQAFLDRAGKIAQSRVDAGVHYPTDIAEGEVLGKATGAAILANADFQKDLAMVQAELKK